MPREGNAPDRGLMIESAYAKGRYNRARDLLRGMGYNLKDINSNKRGAGLKAAYEMWVNGVSAKDFNTYIASVRRGNRNPSPDKYIPGGSGSGGGGRTSTGGGGGGAVAPGILGPGLTGVDQPTDYGNFQDWAGSVPGLVSTGTLMGRNPFGKGFGFNPVDFARAVTEAEYNPQFQSLTNQIKLEKELSGAAEGRINEAFDPLIAQMDKGAQARLNTNMNVNQALAALGQQLGGQAAPAAAQDTTGMLGELAKLGFSDDQSRKESAARDKANVLSGFLSERNASIRDLRNQRSELQAGKGADYKAALIEGLNLRQNLLTSAVANRGALFNQALTRAMGIPTIAAANIEAQTALDELSRGRSGENREQQGFLAQLEQFARQGRMDDLDYQLGLEELNQARSGGSSSLKTMKPGELGELWNYLAGNYQSVYGVPDDNGNVAVNWQDPQVQQQITGMAQALGIPDDRGTIRRFIESMTQGAPNPDLSWQDIGGSSTNANRPRRPKPKPKKKPGPRVGRNPQK